MKCFRSGKNHEYFSTLTEKLSFLFVINNFDCASFKKFKKINIPTSTKFSKILKNVNLNQ